MMTVAAVNTTAIALFIFGGLLSAYLTLVNYLGGLQSEFTIKFSVVPGLSQEDIHGMAEELRRVEGIAEVTFLPKEIEWEKYIRKLKLERIAEDLPNTLPDQFMVTLSSLEKAEAVKQKIQKHPFFLQKDGFREAREERERVGALLDFITTVGGVFTLVGLFTAGTLIYNTIHLTVLARQRELRTMALVGASSVTLRMPLLVEGALQGLLGGMMAGGVLWLLLSFVGPEWERFFRVEFVPQGIALLGIVCAAGVILGILSAGFSVRRYLAWGIRPGVYPAR
ncbi:MAG: permease-like cell division protein FtsX [Candidatus Caldarchaeum sp.]